MTDNATASQRFPLGVFNARKRCRDLRIKQDVRLRGELSSFRAKLYRAAGMQEHPSMADAGVRYDHLAAGFDALWRIIEQAGGWSTATLAECAKNAAVRDAIKAMGLGAVTMESVALASRSDEFLAYRRDCEYLRCLAAQKKAFEFLPRMMCDAMIREHRFLEAIQKRDAVQDSAQRNIDEMLDDADVDADDIGALLDSFEEDGP
jgi:hypothetical protein